MKRERHHTLALGFSNSLSLVLLLAISELVSTNSTEKNSFCGQTVHNPLFSRIFIRALKNRGCEHHSQTRLGHNNTSGHS